MDDLLARTLAHAERYLSSLPERPVGTLRVPDFEDALTDDGVPAAQVIDELAASAEPGLVATAGPRYFGFVTGGALPAALAADWLVSTWDQNAHAFVGSPAASAIEEIVERWLLDVLGLPSEASVGLVTGAQMANVTCLAAAREKLGPVPVVAGAEAHATIFSALRLLGMASPVLVEADSEGRMGIPELDGPAIVCAQAGNVNSGAFDPLEPIADACRAAGAWLHVDGAFGLWAAASSRRSLLRGSELADSWATDGHKWLNVPYDCGVAIVRDRDAHRAAMSLTASYLVADERRDNYDYTPEASRRARGFAVYAALRSLGRRGLADLVDRCCSLAQLFASLLREGGAEVLNEVVLNQVLVACSPEALARVQAEGTCWAGGTTWHGRHAMRISVSNWMTTESDVSRSVAVILDALRDG
jgi:glutamate/tyrosine decarboxylase-like PLP-dependent enzyme